MLTKQQAVDYAKEHALIIHGPAVELLTLGEWTRADKPGYAVKGTVMKDRQIAYAVSVAYTDEPKQNVIDELKISVFRRLVEKLEGLS